MPGFHDRKSLRRRQARPRESILRDRKTQPSDESTGGDGSRGGAGAADPPMGPPSQQVSRMAPQARHMSLARTSKVSPPQIGQRQAVIGRRSRPDHAGSRFILRLARRSQSLWSSDAFTTISFVMRSTCCWRKRFGRRHVRVGCNPPATASARSDRPGCRVSDDRTSLSSSDGTTHDIGLNAASRPEEVRWTRVTADPPDVECGGSGVFARRFRATKTDPPYGGSRLAAVQSDLQRCPAKDSPAQPNRHDLSGWITTR